MAAGPANAVDRACCERRHRRRAPPSHLRLVSINAGFRPQGGSEMRSMQRLLQCVVVITLALSAGRAYAQIPNNGL
jgi:hypothetical protein